MESLVMALRGLFLRRKPARMNREQTSGAPGGPPPLGPYLVRGSQSGPRLRAPPAGRASALAGDPSPWPAPAAFNIRRPGMAAARTAATLFFGGSVWRPARRSGAGSSVLYCRWWGKGRPPGGRWLQRYRLGQVCALAESACLRPRRRGAAPARDSMPPLPPRRGGRRLDNGKEGSVRETQEGCPSPFKSIVFGTFSKFQKRKRRGKKYFCRAGV